MAQGLYEVVKWWRLRDVFVRLYKYQEELLYPCTAYALPDVVFWAAQDLSFLR